MKLRYSVPFFAALCLCVLPLQAAELVDGAGKAILEQKCTACHDTGRISGQKKTKDAWIDTVSRMMDKGASLSGDDFDTVIDYLAKNYGKEDKIEIAAPAKK
jgi:cytochrome c5